MTLKGRLLLASPLAFVLLAGCGPKDPNLAATVSGNVKFNGSALPGGAVLFQDKNGASYTGALDENGNYTIPQMPAGDYKVLVDTEGLNPAKKPPSYGPGQASPAPQGVTAATGKYVKIPDKYSSVDTSGFTANITSGKQTKNFELKD
jgi:hypothetical protein